MKKNQKRKISFTQEKGVALLMVLSMISILAFVLADFGFENTLNKEKIYGQQDAMTAQNNAQAGLRLALAKLRLYQEAMNKLLLNEAYQKFFPPSSLEKLITEPFIYPIPEGLLKDANIIQKTAMTELTKNIVLRGNVSITARPLGSILNPNHLRKLKEVTKQEGQLVAVESDINEDEWVYAAEYVDEIKNLDGQEKKKIRLSTYMERKIFVTLQRILEEKKDKDPLFTTKYAGLSAKQMVKELKFVVNPANTFPNDFDIQELQNLYSRKEINAKHAPMTSMSEFYALQTWPSEIVDLVLKNFSVHAEAIIDVNRVTDTDLLFLFPELQKDNLKRFFSYRDGGGENKLPPNPLKDFADFQKAIVTEAQLLDAESFKKRISELTAVNISFIAASKTFEVISQGSFGRAKFSLMAIVNLPLDPDADKKKVIEKPTAQENPEQQTTTQEERARKPDNKKPPPIQFLPPRVIELRRI